MKRSWFANEVASNEAVQGYQINLAGKLALELIERWGMVVVKTGQEDSAGRASMEPMPADQVVTRAFDIAEMAVTLLERRLWIREATITPDQAHRQAGEWDAIRDNGRYQRDRVAEAKRLMAGEKAGGA